MVAKSAMEQLDVTAALAEALRSVFVSPVGDISATSIMQSSVVKYKVVEAYSQFIFHYSFSGDLGFSGHDPRRCGLRHSRA
jgi:hypothetical protein